MTQHSQPESEPPHSPTQTNPLAAFFFTQQIFGILLTFLVVMGGFMGYLSMVKEADPDIKIAQAVITTEWPGTDAETIENRVTNEIEDEIKSVQGLKSVKSATFNSFSLINVEFRAEAPVSESIQLLRGKLDDAEPELPSESEGRRQPEFEQVSAQDQPVLTVALGGAGLDVATLSRAALDLQDLLESVKNVREVNLAGEREEVIHVQMIPNRLRTLGISATAVQSAIQTGNSDSSWDLVRDDAIGAQVRLYGRFRTLEDLRQLPVARLNENRVVRLEEVADVRRDLEREESRAELSWEGEDFQPTINLDIVKVAGTDSIQVVDDTLAALEAATQDPELWPFGMEYRVLSTDAETIQDDLFNLGSNVVQASLGVFAVLFFALTWREAILAGLAIPVTFLAAIFALWLGGQTLNTMVLVGMILSLGLLVDVFILMLEGLHEGIFGEGLSFPEAALETVKTYAAPAFTGQLTTIFAMAPLMAISGTMGKFIRLIPISAITCLLISYGLALLVVVPLSKFLLDGANQGGSEPTFIDRLTKQVSEGFTAWSLNNTVRSRGVARFWTLGAIAAFVCAALLFGSLPANLFPNDDGLKLSVNVELPPSATLSRSQEVANILGEYLRTYSDDRGERVLESVTKFAGSRSSLVSSGELKPGNADYFVGLSAIFRPRSERRDDSFNYAREIRQDLDTLLRQYPGATLAVQYARSGGSEDPIQVELRGPDMATLRDISTQVQAELRAIPGTMDVRDDLGNLRSDYKMVPRREALDFYGMDQNDIADQGRLLMIDNRIGDFPVGSGEDDLEIHLSTAWPSLDGAVGGPSRQDEFATIEFIAPDGQTVPADAILEPVQGAVPLSITHRDSQRTVTIFAKNMPGIGVYDSQILAELTPKLDELQKSWPAGYSYRFGGDAETQGETFASAAQMLVVAIFLVFSVLVLQFGSYTQPIIIMLTIPFGMIGTFFGFFLGGLPFSFPAMIGIISLIGIVVNDAIVMVETMNSYYRGGMPVREAAARGVSDRIRPILTTTITTVVGLVPLALSDAIWFPLCMAIVFGLMSATIIALFVIPGLYLQFTPDRR
ncbi:MAG: efflux RND transporter permease subunit [Spirulina sp. SIO3F2]|nr:efflux RND transporter permease subunit [Spirulina sp. SIO3F2]